MRLCRTTLAVATKVTAGMITSSPSSQRCVSFIACRAICRALVPLLLMMPKRHPCSAAKSDSKRCVIGPYESRLLSNASRINSLARARRFSVPTPITGAPEFSRRSLRGEICVLISGADRIFDKALLNGISYLHNTLLHAALRFETQRLSHLREGDGDVTHVSGKAHFFMMQLPTGDMLLD